MMMRSLYWIRDGETAVPFIGALLEWARIWEEQRIVKHTRLYVKEMDVLVSTIFLGIDHNFVGEGPPLLWETMLLGTELLDHLQRRDSTQAEAIALHDEIVHRLVTDYGAMRVIDACFPGS